MSKLSPKHQFRLERKYRRRAALKFARPKWVKTTKLIQWGVIGCKFSVFVRGKARKERVALIQLVSYSCFDIRFVVYGVG